MSSAACESNEPCWKESDFISKNATVEATRPSDMTIGPHPDKKTQILVRWTPPSVPVIHYFVTRTDDTDYRLILNNSHKYKVPGTSKQVSIPFIFPGRRYTITLQTLYMKKFSSGETKRYQNEVNGTYITAPDTDLKV